MRAQIIKKTPEEKVEFYVNEKRKREEMECGEKRTIAEMKGSLEVGTEHSDDWLDIDNFETFEDFALRMIGLRRAQDEAGCEPLWLAELGNPEKVKTFRRGQWLLGKYCGLQHQDKQSEKMTISVKRAQHIGGQEEYEKFKEVATETYQKRINAKGASLVQPSYAPMVSAYDVENDVQPDLRIAEQAFGSKSVNKLLMEELAEKARQEQSLEQALLAKGLEFLEKEKEKKRRAEAEGSEADGAVVKKSKTLLPVRKLEMETKLRKTKMQWEDGGQETPTKLEAEVADASELALADDETFLAKKTAVLEAIKAWDVVVQSQVDKWDAAVTAVMAAKDDSELDKIETDFEATKTFLKANAQVDLKAQITKTFTDLKSFMLSMRRETAKKEATMSRATSSKRGVVKAKGKAKPGAPVESRLLKELCQAKADWEAKPLNLKWNPTSDLLEATCPSAVMVPPERCATLVGNVSRLPYFKSQQAWVKTIMSKNGQTTQAAHIMKASAIKTVKTEINNALSEESHAKLKPVEVEPLSALHDPLAVQFFQHQADAKIVSTTPLLLPEVKICLQGRYLLAGVSFDAIEGDSLADKKEVLRKTTATQFYNLAESAGWSTVMTAGSVIMLPPSVFVVELAFTECHGLRWSAYGSDKLKALTYKLLQRYMHGRPELQASPLKDIVEIVKPFAEALMPDPLVAAGGAGSSMADGPAAIADAHAGGNATPPAGQTSDSD